MRVFIEIAPIFLRLSVVEYASFFSRFLVHHHSERHQLLFFLLLPLLHFFRHKNRSVSHLWKWLSNQTLCSSRGLIPMSSSFPICLQHLTRILETIRIKGMRIHLRRHIVAPGSLFRPFSIAIRWIQYRNLRTKNEREESSLWSGEIQTRRVGGNWGDFGDCDGQRENEGEWNGVNGEGDERGWWVVVSWKWWMMKWRVFERRIRSEWMKGWMERKWREKLRGMMKWLKRELNDWELGENG